MIMELPKTPDEERLVKAMAGQPPKVGAELEKLLLAWFSISSAAQPEQANKLRFPFLKWAVQGQAKDTLAYLKKSKTPRAKEVALEIERISRLPFPPKNERAQADAMEIWAWLKLELYGSLE